MDRHQLLRGGNRAARGHSNMRAARGPARGLLNRCFFSAIAVLLFAIAPGSAIAACNSPSGKAGEIETFPADRIMRYCNGSSWVDVGVAGNAGAGNANPQILKTYHQMAGSRSPVIVGNYLYYVSIYGNAFGVIDISSADSPVMVGYVENNTSLNRPWAVDIKGNYAYVLTHDSTTDLTVIDISNPAAPAVVASVDLAAAAGKTGASHNLYDIDIEGNYAYIAANIGMAPVLSGVLVVDISAPTAPVQVGTLHNTSRFSGASQIAVQGNYAYVASSNVDYLAIVNISTPATPTLAGSLTNASLDEAMMVTVSGSHAYVMTGKRILNVIDVSTPATPTSVATFDLAAAGFVNTLTIGSPGDLLVNGNELYLGAYRTLMAIDISTPASPASKGLISNSGDFLNHAYALAIKGNRIYGATGSMPVFNIANPASLAVVDEYFYCCGNQRFFSSVVQSQVSQVYDNYMFLAETYNNINVQRIHVMDVTDPLTPVVRGHLDISSRTILKVQYHEGYLYVLGSSWGWPLTIIDVRDPDNPTMASRVANATIDPSYNGINDASLNYPYLYVTGVDQKILTVIDVSNPAVPVVRGKLSHAHFTGNLAIASIGNTVYISAQTSKTLTAVNASNPDSPVAVGTLSFTTLDHGGIYADKARQMVYVPGGTGSNDFSAVDVSDPTNPVILGGGDAPFGACSARRFDNHLFVWSYARLTIWDAISTPAMTQQANISHESLVGSGCPSTAISMRGNYLFVNSVLGPVVIDPGTNYSGGTSDSSVCTGPDGRIGSMHYDKGRHALRMCNGSLWVDVGAAGNGGAGCGGGALEGASRFNSTSGKYEFCGGTTWSEFN